MNEIFSIEILGVRIDEPLTVLTDIIISLVCLYSLIRLFRIQGSRKLRIIFILFFAFLGTGTLLGGVLGHGFFYLLHPAWKLPGFIASMIAVALLVQASVNILGRFVQLRTWLILTWLNGLLLLTFLILLSLTQEFMYVVLYVTLGVLILVGSMQVVVYWKSGAAGSKWFLLAVGTGLAGDLVYVLDLSPREWFNKNDLGHILLAVSTVFFYLGARLFLSVKDRIDLAGNTEAESSLQE